MGVNIEQVYSFSYTDGDGKEHTKTIKTPGATWSECLNDYVRFLESVFGYEIMSQVRLKDNVFRRSLLEDYPYYEFTDPWSGGYFVDEQDESEEEYDENLGDS